MKKAFIFPGQGAQYPGMGKDIVEGFAVARHTLEEADDILGRKLSEIILNGPEQTLTETKNSQAGIFVISIAMLRVIHELFPELAPDFCAGLSLGEYTAATAAGYLTFSDALPLVQHRGHYMNEACEATNGTMAVVLGMDGDAVESIVRDLALPNDLWAANFNCPGQVVISGTVKGVGLGSKLALERGAKRVLPLQVHGAFHSGLMESARKNLAPHIESVPLQSGCAELVMNVTGTVVKDPALIRKNLIEQVTSPVKWEKGIRSLDKEHVVFYIEIGPGKTLAGFNKRIGVSGRTISIEKTDDLKNLETMIQERVL
jgi:[acyl-carrier-protein] S-malonyltransferase